MSLVTVPLCKGHFTIINPSTHQPEKMNKPNTPGQTWKTRTHQKTIHLAYWTAGWLLTTALATFGPIALWGDTQWLTLLAVLVNALIGLGMILTNVQFLKLQDEFMQKVQLQAMGITLGLSLVAGITFSLLDTTNLIRQDAEISVLILFMGLTYLTTLWITLRRYR
jgi:hypothetical protein